MITQSHARVGAVVVHGVQVHHVVVEEGLERVLRRCQVVLLGRQKRRRLRVRRMSDFASTGFNSNALSFNRPFELTINPNQHPLLLGVGWQRPLVQ
jgi:hypothetical protein